MKKYKKVIAVGIILIFIYYIYHHSNDFIFLLSLNPMYLLPIVLLIFFRLILRGVSLHVILLTAIPDLNFSNTFRSFVISQFLPQGGVIFQGMLLKKRTGLTYKKYIALILAFKILNILILLPICSIIINIFDQSISFFGIPLSVLFMIVFIINVFILSALKLTEKYYPNSLYRLFPFKPVRILSEILLSIAETFSKPKIIISIFCIILINGAISVAILYFIFESIGSSQSFVNLVIYSTTLKLASIIRITPSNIGIREFLIGYLAANLGSTIAEGITVSIIERLIKFCVQGILSLLMSFLPESHSFKDQN